MDHVLSYKSHIHVCTCTCSGVGRLLHGAKKTPQLWALPRFTVMAIVYHKGAISPFVYRDGPRDSEDEEL